MPKVVVYADGPCSGNPGPGGWAAILLNENGSRKVISGGEPATTNNRMDLYAAIAGLEALGGPAEVVLKSDSNYLVRRLSERWHEG